MHLLTNTVSVLTTSAQNITPVTEISSTHEAVCIWKLKHFPGLLSRLLAAMATMLVSE